MKRRAHHSHEADVGTTAVCLAVLLLLTAWVSPLSAATVVYHCTVNGQTVLTDKACATAPSDSDAATDKDQSSPTAKEITALPTVVDEWKGQTQYQGTENGQLIANAHSVVVLRLTFTEDGKVFGDSPDNGCKVLGIWLPNGSPRLFTLDLTLSACRYEGFNRRYSGTFLATFEKLSGQLSLQAYTVPIPGAPVRRYDVAATLKR